MLKWDIFNSNYTDLVIKIGAVEKSIQRGSEIKATSTKLHGLQVAPANHPAESPFLFLDHVPVQPIEGHQFVMCAMLSQFAVVHDKYDISVSDRV
jgi:hypothetical protein